MRVFLTKYNACYYCELCTKLVCCQQYGSQCERDACRNRNVAKYRFTIMEPLRVFKSLSNENRLRIVQWLAEPTQHFPPQQEEDMEDVGVCVDFIRRKLDVSQSTTSQYLSKLEDAGLITSQRIGQWTYYQRDEETIEEFADFVRDEL